MKSRALAGAWDGWRDGAAERRRLTGTLSKVSLRLRSRSLFLASSCFFYLRKIVRRLKMNRVFKARKQLFLSSVSFESWSSVFYESQKISRLLKEGLQRMKIGMQQLYAVRLSRVMIRRNSFFMLSRTVLLWRMLTVGSLNILYDKDELNEYHPLKKSIEPKATAMSDSGFSLRVSQEPAGARTTPNIAADFEGVSEPISNLYLQQPKFELYLLEQSSTWLKIAWKLQSGTSSLNAVYSLQWKKEEDTAWNSVTESIPIARVRLEHLRPGTRYTFRVRTMQTWQGIDSWSEYGDATTFSTLALGYEDPDSALAKASPEPIEALKHEIKGIKLMKQQDIAPSQGAVPSWPAAGEQKLNVKNKETKSIGKESKATDQSVSVKSNTADRSIFSANKEAVKGGSKSNLTLGKAPPAAPSHETGAVQDGNKWTQFTSRLLLKGLSSGPGDTRKKGTSGIGLRIRFDNQVE